MKRSYLIALILGLGGLAIVGFSLGYVLHMSQALEKFAREASREPSDYDWNLYWLRPPGGGSDFPAVVASPKPGKEASRDACSRWRWSSTNPAEPCEPDQHRLVWRARADRWELVDDLGQDASAPPFPDDS